MSSASVSASTSRGQHEQLPSARAAKRLLPHRVVHSRALPGAAARKRELLSGRGSAESPGE
eukprot:4134-Alexandrium_andersonii.AAC.1